jgi:carboxymethylenebutenolidase
MVGMCYSIDARPPLPPIIGGSSDETDLVLTAADGGRFNAFAVPAERPSGAGIVILPDPRGLAPFYLDLTRRFAQAGIEAVAVDYVDPTASLRPRLGEIDFRALIQGTTAESIDAAVAAAINHLRTPDGGAVSSVFTVGFCFGGSTSWRQSAVQPGLAGAIGFYGVPARVRDAIPKMKAPLLLLVAGADGATSPEENGRFDEELTKAGVPHKSVVYDGAPHSFFDRRYEDHQKASEDAWGQMLAFIKEHTRQPART